MREIWWPVASAASDNTKVGRPTKGLLAAKLR